MNVLVLGRERHLVDASTTVIEESGFGAVGVTRDEEAFALLGTGRFGAVLVGSGVEAASRPPVGEHAAAHATVVLQARRVPGQTVQEHLREVVVPRLRELAASAVSGSVSGSGSASAGTAAGAGAAPGTAEG